MCENSQEARKVLDDPEDYLVNEKKYTHYDTSYSIIKIS